MYTYIRTGFVLTLLFVAVAACDRSPEQKNEESLTRTVPPPPPPVPSTSQTPTGENTGGNAAIPAIQPSVVPSSVDVPMVETNLIPNGDFDNWPDDQRVPIGWSHGFGYSLDTIPSVINQYRGPTYDNWKAVEQTWDETDATDSAFRLFGVTVETLEPDSDYLFTFKAVNPEGAPVHVGLWGVSDVEAQEVTQDELPRIALRQSDDFEDYFVQFHVSDVEALRIASYCGKAEFPVSVVWDKWELEEVQESGVNLFQNGHFGNWPNGQRLPVGWTHAVGYAKGSAPSTIERFSGNAPRPGQLVLQSWEKSDASDSVFRQFGQTVTNGIKPRTLYRVTLRALNLGASPVSIAPWDVSAGENAPVKKLAQPFITVQSSSGMGFVDYSAVFNSANATSVRIVTLSPNAGAKVIWASFELREVGPAD